MPPKTKKRKAKETEEELEFLEKLNDIFYKYRCEEENGEEVGMFGAEEAYVISIKDLDKVGKEMGMKWDESILAILSPEQLNSGTLDFETTKLLLSTLETVQKQEDDIQYLFNTFSDPSSKQITCESLSRALKHLSIRESSEKIALLMAFAHRQSFLQIILSEQTTGNPMSALADKSGVNFEEFKGAFVRSSFLSNK